MIILKKEWVDHDLVHYLEKNQVADQRLVQNIRRKSAIAHLNENHQSIAIDQIVHFQIHQRADTNHRQNTKANDKRDVIHGLHGLGIEEDDLLHPTEAAVQAAPLLTQNIRAGRHHQIISCIEINHLHLILIKFVQ